MSLLLLFGGSSSPTPSPGGNGTFSYKFNVFTGTFDIVGGINSTSGSGITIGSSVIGGTINTILYIDGSGNVRSNSNLSWNETTTLLTVKSNSISTEPIIQLKDSFGNDRFEVQANGRMTTDFMDWDIISAPYPVNFVYPMTIVESTVYGAGATSETLFVHNISTAMTGIVAYGLAIGVDATGYSNNIAISASANNADAMNIAVQANATTSVTGTNIGVYGNVTNSGNIAYAIYGVAPLTTDNWAGYFDGTVNNLHDVTFGGQLILTRSTFSESSGNQTWIGRRPGSHITVQGATSDVASIAGNFYGLGGDAADSSSTAADSILDAGNPTGGTLGIIQLGPDFADHIVATPPLWVGIITDLIAQSNVIEINDGGDNMDFTVAQSLTLAISNTLIVNSVATQFITVPGFDTDGFVKNDVNGFISGGHQISEVTGSYSQTNLTANPGPVTISGAGGVGLYRLTYDMETVTADALAVSAQLSISYTDRIGATTQLGTLLSLVSTTRVHGIIELYLASGGIDFNVTIVTIGSAKFSLDIACEKLY